MLGACKGASGGYASLLVAFLRARLPVFCRYGLPGVQGGRAARFRAVVLMGAVCRWVRSNELGDYCQYTGLFVWRGSRCMASPKVRVNSCYGDLDTSCRTCGLAGSLDCPAHEHDAWAFSDCPFWTAVAPLPHREDAPDSGQLSLPGCE